MRSTVSSAGNAACVISPLRLVQRTRSSVCSMRITLEMRFRPDRTDSIGAVCPVSPISVCLPQITRSGSSFLTARERVYAVANVSAPAKILSLSKIAFAAPNRVNRSRKSFALSGPMLRSMTCAP